MRKAAADLLIVQVGFDLEKLLARRDSVTVDGDVYAGGMVIPSVSMARKLVADIPEITIPSAASMPSRPTGELAWSWRASWRRASPKAAPSTASA